MKPIFGVQSSLPLTQAFFAYCSESPPCTSVYFSI